MERCAWCTQDPVYQAYHDKEWGVPVHDDTTLFEYLILEGAQAGLSWITILKRRENYRRAFDFFDPHKVAQYEEAKIQALLQDPGIIRNKLKVNAAVTNARAFLEIQKEFGSFDAYAWGFVGGTPKMNFFDTLDQVPVTTRESDAFSKDLKKRGFKFTGSVIIYSFMQACGLVNDHLTTCFRHKELLEDRHGN